jgi:hypothetical protein
MAKQNGPFNVRGKVGNLVFYKSGDQFLVRSAPKSDRKKKKNDPAYACRQQNNADFSTAAKAGKLLRRAFASIIPVSGDSSLTARIVKYMMIVVKSDAVNAFGKRNINHGYLEVLKRFQFNKALSLHRTLFAIYKTTFDRQTGQGTIDFQPYISHVLIAAPEAATHYTFIFAMAACNFAKHEYHSDVCFSEPQPFASVPSALTTLTATLPAACTDPVFVVLGIMFSSLVNGTYEPVGGSKNCATAIVEVNCKLK